MTLLTEGSPDLDSPASGGVSSQASGSTSGGSPRSNPVCLDVPVAIRSLPADKSNSSSGPAAPFSEEARTVIVFENGAVLRVSGNLPVGQEVVVSNAQGREVVCRLARTRNLPSVKGYVEIEFTEPVIDFWGIHQIPPQASAPAPARSLTQSSPPGPAGGSHELSAPPPVVPTMGVANLHGGSAPSFEDIAGVMPIASELAEPGQPKQTVPHTSTPKTKAKLGGRQLDDAKPAAQGGAPAPTISAPAPSARDGGQAGARTPGPRKQSDFPEKGILGTAQISLSSTASGSRGKTTALTVGAMLVLAGLAAGYFFFYRGGVAPSSIAVPVATPPSGVTLPGASSPNPPGENPPAAEEREPAASQPVANVDSISEDREAVQAPSASPAPRHRIDNAVERTPIRPAVRQQSIPNLKMKAPKAPRQNAERRAGETPPKIAELGSEPEDMSAMKVLLPAVARTSILPAPPPPASASAAPSGEAVRDPKLISSIRPAYPSVARQAGIEGDVVISAEIDATGKVREAKALSGPATLRQAAIDTIRQWKYAPALIDGKPAPAQVTVHVEFRLH
jgi:TonB family protein